MATINRWIRLSNAPNKIGMFACCWKYEIRVLKQPKLFPEFFKNRSSWSSNCTQILRWTENQKLTNRICLYMYIQYVYIKCVWLKCTNPGQDSFYSVMSGTWKSTKRGWQTKDAGAPMRRQRVLVLFLLRQNITITNWQVLDEVFKELKSTHTFFLKSKTLNQN